VRFVTLFLMKEIVGKMYNKACTGARDPAETEINITRACPVMLDVTDNCYIYVTKSIS